jgi:hypothetical protein
MKRIAFAAALALAVPLLAGSSPASAQQGSGDDDIFNKIISVPLPSGYRVDGMQGKPPVRSDKAVQGGKALRVDVPGKAPNPWAIAVSVPINKPVKAGDKLVLAMWARLEKGENGATTATLAHNAVQLAHAPYTALFAGPLEIGPEWKLQQIEGVSNANYAAGDLNVSIHLATAKQIVDIGPVFVLDMGQ